MGRSISRAPLGYVDGMSSYNGYFAERFMLDPEGTRIGVTGWITVIFQITRWLAPPWISKPIPRRIGSGNGLVFKGCKSILGGSQVQAPIPTNTKGLNTPAGGAGFVLGATIAYGMTVTSTVVPPAGKRSCFTGILEIELRGSVRFTDKISGIMTFPTTYNISIGINTCKPDKPKCMCEEVNLDMRHKKRNVQHKSDVFFNPPVPPGGKKRPAINAGVFDSSRLQVTMALLVGWLKREK